MYERRETDATGARTGGVRREAMEDGRREAEGVKSEEEGVRSEQKAKL
jgi:hypothetical protein